MKKTKWTLVFFYKHRLKWTYYFRWLGSHRASHPGGRGGTHFCAAAMLCLCEKHNLGDWTRKDNFYELPVISHESCLSQEFVHVGIRINNVHQSLISCQRFKMLIKTNKIIIHWFLEGQSRQSCGVTWSNQASLRHCWGSNPQRWKLCFVHICWRHITWRKFEEVTGLERRAFFFSVSTSSRNWGTYTVAKRWMYLVLFSLAIAAVTVATLMWNSAKQLPSFKRADLRYLKQFTSSNISQFSVNHNFVFLLVSISHYQLAMSV